MATLSEIEALVIARSKTAANRVYALYHLKRLRKKYPEIDAEVKAQIQLIEELGDIKPALKVGIRNYLSA